jgi:hypothetical protein
VRAPSVKDQFEESDGPVRIDYLRVSSRAGCIKSSEPYAELQAGQRMLIARGNHEEKALVSRRGKRTDHALASSIRYAHAGSRLRPGWRPTRRGRYPRPSSKYDLVDIAKALADVGLSTSTANWTLRNDGTATDE